MTASLPPGLSQRAFDRALSAFEGAVGKRWVLATEQDRDSYTDLYTPGDPAQHAPAAAVAPGTVEEVQAVVRLANENRVPLWPISRGKNLGYGGSAPRLPGSVVLDLGRMKRILEVNEQHGYCLVEPGVGFFDLYQHLQDHKIGLWMSVPGNAWGSVMGNALDRGIGHTPYGDHSAQICGLEVVLPTGELLRTGMGAMQGSASWQLHKHGFGPEWDSAFVQSNFGVVTKMGLWLMRAPESTVSMRMSLPEPDDIGWAIDTLVALKRRGIITQNLSVSSYIAQATMRSQRYEWQKESGPLGAAAISAMMRAYNVGWWNFNIQLFGLPEVNDIHVNLIREAFVGKTDQEFKVTRWKQGEPMELSGAGVPSVLALQMINWHGGRGGHLGFSPVLPQDGALALKQFRNTRARYEEFGQDYFGTFYLGDRHMTNVNMMAFDRDDADMTGKARALFAALIKDAAADGYAEYRTHLSYMDDVAGTFNFNNHALRAFNERVKDAIDPNGILAPGKSGIWPKNYRRYRT
jgi:4-cresol dehydrogenase (hydroxylating) flavoprotein subunit